MFSRIMIVGAIAAAAIGATATALGYAPPANAEMVKVPTIRPSVRAPKVTPPPTPTAQIKTGSGAGKTTIHPASGNPAGGRR